MPRRHQFQAFSSGVPGRTVLPEEADATRGWNGGASPARVRQTTRERIGILGGLRADARLNPLLPQQPHHHGVLTLAVHEVALAKLPFAPESQAVEQSDRSL